MKILLITGATGFIGSHLVKNLLKSRQYKIRIFIRAQSNLSRLEKILNKIEVFKGDFNKDQDIENSLKNVNIFIHLASVLQRGRKEEYQKFNINVSERFFFYSSKFKIKKVIFLSSFEVMGGSKDPHYYSELDPPNPLSSYGKSKYEVEKIAQKYIQERGLNITIFRIPAVYGPEDNFDRGFIRIIDMIAGNKFICFGKQNNYMSLIYIDNLIDIILKCIKSKKSNKQLYFVADKEILTVKEICNLIVKLTNAKQNPIRIPVFLVKIFADVMEFSGKIFNFLPFFPENFVHNVTANYACSMLKVEKELKWAPSYSLYEGMKETVKWYKKTKR